MAGHQAGHREDEDRSHRAPDTAPGGRRSRPRTVRVRTTGAEGEPRGPE